MSFEKEAHSFWLLFFLSVYLVPWAVLLRPAVLKPHKTEYKSIF